MLPWVVFKMTISSINNYLFTGTRQGRIIGSSVSDYISPRSFTATFHAAPCPSKPDGTGYRSSPLGTFTSKQRVNSTRREVCRSIRSERYTYEW